MKSPRVNLPVTIVWLLLAGHEAPGCSCLVVSPEPPEVLFAQTSDAVFSARVVSITKLSSAALQPADPSCPATLIVLKVLAAWKGVHRADVVLVNDITNCAYPFELGREYLVYAYASPGGVSTSVCSHTRLLSKAASALASLGSPEVVF